MLDQFLRQGFRGGFATDGFFAGLASGPTGLSLPAWLTHSWEALDAGVADGDPVTTQTCPISGVVRTSTGTEKPTYRADYAGSGVAAYEYDGVNDRSVTTTNVDHSSGYTYTALVNFESALNFRVLFDIYNGMTLYGSGSNTLVYSDGTTSTQTAIPTIGSWAIVTAMNDGEALRIWVNRVLMVETVGTFDMPAANTIQFGSGRGPFAVRKMKGGVAADYFGPVSNGTQRTALWDYINAKHGTAL